MTERKTFYDSVINKHKIIEFKKPGEIPENLLTGLLRNAAQQLMADAVEEEPQKLLRQYNSAINKAIAR